MSRSQHSDFVRVGIAQIQIALCQREKNKDTVRAWMEKNYIASDLPTAIVLPELWDVGYALDAVPELADPEGKEAIAFLGQLARKYHTWFIGGSVMVENDGRYFNQAQVISPRGDLVAVYNKVHLVPFITKENDVFARGHTTSIFDFGPAKAGNIICYDIRFPEWVRVYALKGTQILFVAGQWAADRMHLWKTMLRAHAIENAMYVAAANCCGVSGKLEFGGQSLVCSPNGEVLFEAGAGQDAGFVEIDIASVDATRNFLQIFENRIPSLYKRLVG